MTTSRDDDALSWAGEDDPTLAPSASSAPHPDPSAPAKTPSAPLAQEPATPEPSTPAQATSEQPTVLEQAELVEDAEVEAELAAAENASAQMSSAALITLGILGGVYLLYTIGWGIVVARTTITFFPLDSLFLEICFRIGQFLSIASAPLWFVSTLLITQKKTWRSRLGWLLLGMFVLVPWPFIQGA